MNPFLFRCFHCEKPLAISWHGFCCRCTASLRHTCYCGHCGSNLAENRLACGHCLQDEPKWHKLVKAGDYRPPLSHWIHRFKFNNGYYLDQALARLLLLAVKNAQRQHGLRLPEVIIPVPLFWLRQWQRGYNQAELISRHLSRWLQIPQDTDSLRRVRSTSSQRELRAVERRANLKKAFQFRPLVAYNRVAIVDDVLTTGSTLNTICVELLKQNVSEIQVWTLART